MKSAKRLSRSHSVAQDQAKVCPISQPPFRYDRTLVAAYSMPVFEVGRRPVSTRKLGRSRPSTRVKPLIEDILKARQTKIKIKLRDAHEGCVDTKDIGPMGRSLRYREIVRPRVVKSKPPQVITICVQGLDLSGNQKEGQTPEEGEEKNTPSEVGRVEPISHKRDMKRKARRGVAAPGVQCIYTQGGDSPIDGEVRSRLAIGCDEGTGRIDRIHVTCSAIFAHLHYYTRACVNESELRWIGVGFGSGIARWEARFFSVFWPNQTNVGEFQIESIDAHRAGRLSIRSGPRIPSATSALASGYSRYGTIAEPLRACEAQQQKEGGGGIEEKTICLFRICPCCQRGVWIAECWDLRSEIGVEGNLADLCNKVSLQGTALAQKCRKSIQPT
ncbi:hypothetical protein AG1IA_07364 [Rhizoctonia solani AG-1 IA]|uniref:Uncharacterized protein n=1 Tax=Thanatephorus cucumeris (strain AG1-IA) TaxID=983506 RepID=L8WK68_THACA|nr:hypothetical protein AG1IA_07364 [Rhizoctonia solani AG-1 IA]